MDQKNLVELVQQLLEEVEKLKDREPEDIATVLVKIRERIRTQRELVEALNVEPAPPDVLAHFIEHQASVGLVPQDEENLVRKSELSSRLRSFVDPWLSSGLNPDGSESPPGRKLPNFPTYPAHIERSPNWANDFLESIDRDTDRLLRVLYRDDWGKCALCKCRLPSCGRYFWKDPLRQHYKHGTFCGEHQNHVSAVAGRRKGRAAAENELIDCAAKSLLTYPTDKRNWREDSKYKKQLAAMLSDYIYEKGFQSYWPGVTTNWINRRLRQIEQKRHELTGDEVC
jgi:hypothetical protein